MTGYLVGVTLGVLLGRWIYSPPVEREPRRWVTWIVQRLERTPPSVAALAGLSVAGLAVLGSATFGG